jgi:hypothetical protein
MPHDGEVGSIAQDKGSPCSSRSHDRFQICAILPVEQGCMLSRSISGVIIRLTLNHAELSKHMLANPWDLDLPSHRSSFLASPRKDVVGPESTVSDKF